jgi:hypothetical protein
MADGGHHTPLGCGKTAPARHEYRVATLGLDAFELAALAIMRLIFASFADPASHAWLRAARAAETCFEDGDAGARFLDLLRVVREMRMARQTPFRFSNADCACCAGVVTEAERHLMLAMRAARRGDRGTANAQALMLCEGGDTSGLLAALHDLPPAAIRAGPRMAGLHRSARRG